MAGRLVEQVVLSSKSSLSHSFVVPNFQGKPISEPNCRVPFAEVLFVTERGRESGRENNIHSLEMTNE
jgi:hypothetical protein